MSNINIPPITSDKRDADRPITTKAFVAPAFKEDEQSSEITTTEGISSPTFDEDELKDSEITSTEVILSPTLEEPEEKESEVTSKEEVPDVKEDEQKGSETTSAEEGSTLKEDERRDSGVTPTEEAISAPAVKEDEEIIPTEAPLAPIPNEDEQKDSEITPTEEAFLTPTPIEDEQKDSEIAPTETQSAPTLEQKDSDTTPTETLLPPMFKEDERKGSEIIRTQALSAPTLETHKPKVGEIIADECHCDEPTIRTPCRCYEDDAEAPPAVESTYYSAGGASEAASKTSSKMPSGAQSKAPCSDAGPCGVIGKPCGLPGTPCERDGEPRPPATPEKRPADDTTAVRAAESTYYSAAGDSVVPSKVSVEASSDDTAKEKQPKRIDSGRGPSDDTEGREQRKKSVDETMGVKWQVQEDPKPLPSLPPKAVLRERETMTSGDDTERLPPKIRPVAENPSLPQKELLPCDEHAICSVMQKPCAMPPPQPCGEDAACYRMGAPCRLLQMSEGQLKPKPKEPPRISGKPDTHSCPSCSEEGPCYKGEPCCPTLPSEARGRLASVKEAGGFISSEAVIQITKFGTEGHSGGLEGIPEDSAEYDTSLKPSEKKGPGEGTLSLVSEMAEESEAQKVTAEDRPTDVPPGLIELIEGEIKVRDAVDALGDGTRHGDADLVAQAGMDMPRATGDAGETPTVTGEMPGATGDAGEMPSAMGGEEEISKRTVQPLGLETPGGRGVSPMTEERAPPPKQVRLDMDGLTADQIAAMPSGDVPRGVQLDTVSSLGTAVPFKEERTGAIPFDIDTVAVLDQPPSDLHVTTTITRSGTLEVITEGPGGTIETTLVYKEDGTIEVTTQITEAPGGESPIRADYAQQKPSRISDVTETSGQRVSSSFETSVYSAPAESDLQRELMLAEEPTQESLMSGETGLTGLETASEQYTTKDSTLLSSSEAGLEELEETQETEAVGSIAGEATEGISIEVSAVSEQGEAEKISALSEAEAVSEHGAGEKTSVLSEAVAGEEAIEKISAISEAAAEGEATEEISAVSEAMAEGGEAIEEISAVSETTAGGEAIEEISAVSEATAGGEAIEEISAVSEATAEGEAIEEISAVSEATVEGEAIEEISARSEILTEEEAIEKISAVSEAAAEEEGAGEKLSAILEAEAEAEEEAFSEQAVSEAAAEEGAGEKISALSAGGEAEQEAAKEKVSAAVTELSDEGLEMEITSLDLEAAESKVARELEEGEKGEAEEEAVSPAEGEEGVIPSAKSEEGAPSTAESEEEELLSALGEEGIIQAEVVEPEIVPTVAMQLGEMTSAAGGEGEILSAAGEAEVTSFKEGEGKIPSMKSEVEAIVSGVGEGGVIPPAEGEEGVIPPEGQEETSLEEGEEVLSVIEAESELLPTSEGEEEISAVEGAEKIVPPMEGEGEAAAAAKQREDVLTEEMASKIDDTSEKRQALKKRDCACQSSPPTDQSCQCCECKDVGVSTAQDSETNTDEIMVQSSSKPTVQTIPEESEPTESSETEFAEATSGGAGKIQGTIDEVSTINEEEGDTVSGQDEQTKQRSEAEGDGPHKSVDDDVYTTACEAACATPLDKAVTETSELTTQDTQATATGSLHDTATCAVQETFCNCDEALGTDKGQDETLTDASMQCNCFTDSEGKPSSASGTDDDKTKPPADVPEPKLPEKSKSKISAEVPESKLPSESSDSKKPRKKRSSKLESMQCLCEGICRCVICSPDIIAKRTAMTGSAEPPRGQTARLCCCVPPFPAQAQPCQAPCMPPGMQQTYMPPPQAQTQQCQPTRMQSPAMPGQQEYMPPQMQAYANQHPVGCACPTCVCMCTPYRPPATEAFLRSTDLSQRPVSKGRQRISIDDVFNRGGNETACTAPCKKGQAPKYDKDPKCGPDRCPKDQARKYERCRHPSNCECVDCLCLPKIKRIAETKEYPIVRDEKQIYQVHTMKCVCPSALKNSKIPIATNSATGPPKVRGPAVCNCQGCSCDPCADPTRGASRQGANGPKAPSICDCANCTCPVCPHKKTSTEPEEQPTRKKNCCCKGECTCDPCPLDVFLLQKTTSTSSHPPDCDCAECVCPQSVSRHGGAGFKVAKKESTSSHPPDCDCTECVCPQSKSRHGGTGFKVTKKESTSSHPPDCDCTECVCPQSKSRHGGTAPKMTQKDSRTSKTSTSSHPPDCDCTECVCPQSKSRHGGTAPKMTQKESRTSTSSHPPGCDCTECVCPQSKSRHGGTPKSGQGPSPTPGAAEKPPGCTCQVCTCPGGPSNIGDAPQQVPPGCNCTTCGCPGLSPSATPALASIPEGGAAIADCDCEVCLCDPCADPKKKKKPGEAPPAAPNIAPCDCAVCKCDPCADPNRKQDVQQPESQKEDEPHSPDCNCPECACVAESETQTPAPSAHPTDCICKVCVCPDEGAPQTESTAVGSREDKETHSPDCICDKCLCEPEEGADGPSSAPSGGPSGGPGAKQTVAIEVVSDAAEHDAGCTCADCICVDCLAIKKKEGGEAVGTSTAQATARGTTPTEVKSTGAGEGRDESCPCARCDDCATQTDVAPRGGVPVTETGAGEAKVLTETVSAAQQASAGTGDGGGKDVCEPTCITSGVETQLRSTSSPAATGTVRHTECPMCTCQDDDVAGVGGGGQKVDKDTGKNAVDNKGLQVGSQSQAREGDASQHAAGCDCPECCACMDVPDVSKLNDAQLMRQIQSEKQENCECRQQMEEIRRALNKIKCACNEAEKKASQNTGTGKPFVKQASSFGQTMSGLKLALSNLQEKCKAKDRMIDVMTGELKLRTSSNTLEKVLNTTTPEEPPDYDKAADVQAPPPRQISTNVLYSVAEEQEVAATRMRRGGHKKRSKGCKCGKSHRDKDTTNNVDLSGFEIIDIRRITQDSIIIKWKPPKNSLITGYDIFVNGVNKSRVMSGGRTSAMIHSLDLSATIQITIYAVTKCGRCEPPAIAIYEIN